MGVNDFESSNSSEKKKNQNMALKVTLAKPFSIYVCCLRHKFERTSVNGEVKGDYKAALKFIQKITRLTFILFMTNLTIIVFDLFIRELECGFGE